MNIIYHFKRVALKKEDKMEYKHLESYGNDYMIYKTIALLQE